MKVVDFKYSSLPVLVAPKLCRFVAVYASYHLSIGIVGVTNTFHNIHKASSKYDIIDFTSH